MILHRDIVDEERLALRLVLIKVRDEAVIAHITDIVAQGLVALIVVDRVKLVEAHVIVNDVPLPVLGQVRVHGHGAEALFAQGAGQAVLIVCGIQVVRRGARRQERRAVSGQDHILRGAGARAVDVHVEPCRERVLVRVQPVEHGPDILADVNVADVTEVRVALIHNEDDVRGRDVFGLGTALHPVRQLLQRGDAVAFRRGNDHVADGTERVQHVAVRLVALGQAPVTHGDPAVGQKLREDQEADEDHGQHTADDRTDQVLPAADGLNAAFAGKDEQRPGHQQCGDHAVGEDPAVSARHGKRGVCGREVVRHDGVALPARHEIIRDAVAREDDLQQHGHHADPSGEEPEEAEDRVKDGNVIAPGVVIQGRQVAVRGLKGDKCQKRSRKKEDVLRDLSGFLIALLPLFAQVRGIQVEETEKQQNDAADAQNDHGADAVMEERDRQAGLLRALTHLIMESRKYAAPFFRHPVQAKHGRLGDGLGRIQRMDRKRVGLALLEIQVSDLNVHGHVLALPLQADIVPVHDAAFRVRDGQLDASGLIPAIIQGEGHLADVAVNGDEILRGGAAVHETDP